MIIPVFCCVDHCSCMDYCYMDILVFMLLDCFLFLLLDMSAVDMRCVELSATWI